MSLVKLIISFKHSVSLLSTESIKNGFAIFSWAAAVDAKGGLMVPSAVWAVTVAVCAVAASMWVVTDSMCAVTTSMWAVTSSMSDITAFIYDAHVLCGL